MVRLCILCLLNVSLPDSHSIGYASLKVGWLYVSGQIMLATTCPGVYILVLDSFPDLYPLQFLLVICIHIWRRNVAEATSDKMFLLKKKKVE